MPKSFKPEMDERVRNFSKQGLSARKIVMELKKSQVSISKSSVNNIINSIGYSRNHLNVGLPLPKMDPIWFHFNNVIPKSRHGGRGSTSTWAKCNYCGLRMSAIVERLKAHHECCEGKRGKFKVKS